MIGDVLVLGHLYGGTGEPGKAVGRTRFRCMQKQSSSFLDTWIAFTFLVSPAEKKLQQQPWPRYIPFNQRTCGCVLWGKGFYREGDIKQIINTLWCKSGCLSVFLCICNPCTWNPGQPGKANLWRSETDSHSKQMQKWRCSLVLVLFYHSPTLEQLREALKKKAAF